jgi:hypothetical protein
MMGKVIPLVVLLALTAGLSLLLVSSGLKHDDPGVADPTGTEGPDPPLGDSDPTGPTGSDEGPHEPSQSALSAKIYQSPTCDCCKDYGLYLRGEGYELDVKETYLVDQIKTDLGIPEGMTSCHTIEIGGYFVEGHMPVEAIRKLMEEQPDIDGIVLPGMPDGVPGMDGNKTGPFIVYWALDGEVGEFMRI